MQIMPKMLRTFRHRITHILIYGLVGLCGLLLWGCASLGVERYQQSITQGDLGKAEEIIGQNKEKINIMLRDLHYGSLKQLGQQYQDSNVYLEQAKKVADKLASVSVSETAAAITVNQRVSQFNVNDFERIMIYFHKSLNYLSAGDVNGARIEMRQAELLLQEIRVGLEVYPFVPLIIALIYEQLGEEENALVAYRRAVDAYGANAAPQLLKKSYLNLLAKNNRRQELATREEQLDTTSDPNVNQASLLIITTRGILTPLDSFTIYHLHPTHQNSFLIALPYYPDYNGIAPPPSLSIGEYTPNFEPIINVEQEMRKSLDKAMPGITAIALARAVVKNQIQQEADRQEDSFFSFAALVYNVASEIADTRSWDTLPQAFYMARLELPAVEYPVTSSYYPAKITPVPSTINLQTGMNILFVQGR